MTSRPDDIHALLSAQLDGVLSAEEQDRLQKLLQSDPSLERELEALTAIRNSLLKGRQQGRLGRDFAAKITQAASTRLAYSPDLQADWVPQPALQPATLSKADSTATIQQRFWIPTAAIAAALCIALLAVQYHRLVNRDTQERLAANRQIEQANERLENSSDIQNGDFAVADFAVNGQGKDVLANNLETDSSSLANAPENDSQIDSANAMESAPNKAIIAETESDTVTPIPPTSIASNSATPATLDSESDADSDTKALTSGLDSVAARSSAARATDASMAADGSKATVSNQPNVNMPAAPALPAYVLMAVHVTQDEVAEQNQALNAILEKHGILAIDDLAIGQAELTTLLATGAAGEISQQGANVYFLKGYARNLSGAIEDICSQYKDFPEFGINITIDDSARVLVKQLREIDIGSSPAVATKVGVQTPSGFVSSFARGSAIPKPMPHSRRQASSLNSMLGSIDTNPISYLLLVVRREVELAGSSQLESTPPEAVAD